jgi:hypothetical protein
MNNIYLYLMLISLLVGGFSGFIGYDNLDSASRQKVENAKKRANLQGRLKDKESKDKELSALQLKRKELQHSVEELAVSIEEQGRLMEAFKNLELKINGSLERQGVKLAVSQETVALMREQLSEDTTAIERALENMNQAYESDRERLQLRREGLRDEETVEAKKNAKLLSQLETNIDAIDFKIRRVSNLSPTEIEEPWVTGKVMDYNSTLNKVVINLGAKDGIRQNFKFSVFSTSSGQEGRIYKGFVVIKKVDDLVSIGAMEMVNGEAPVIGDQLGSLVYRSDRISFYLAGDFRSKYTKDQLKSFLEYSGNRVLDELSSEVDFFVMGSLADNEVPLATALGVSIIPEELIAAYIGE